MSVRIELDDGATAADAIARMRAARGAAVVLVLAPGIDPVERAQIAAALGPLALELAPATRLCAVARGAGGGCRCGRCFPHRRQRDHRAAADRRLAPVPR
ncbi:hypothetical protein [Sphingomonas sp.]|uniref:hypothetical protein n=1 Tax=Sphingomonas sp. TaxID=28214 RepID=UPI001DC99F3F|nr:hypothetical protein [Sphingomonas sp.]MBX9796198.1 hypothetical protein [Sphingomonas sp.]